MVRLYLFGEGLAEQTFADTVLAPHLATLGIVVHAVRNAQAIHGGQVTRGGASRYLRIKNDILRFQRQNAGPDVFFTTMVDFYKLPTDFPGVEDAAKIKNLPRQRVELIEAAVRADMPDPRFIPHVQLHEFEALLFCDTFDQSSYFRLFDLTDNQIEALGEIAASQASPELIDDGLHSAPSKRLEAVYPPYKKKHGTMGPVLAQLIGLAAIRAKCPHFAAWLARLEALVQ